MAEIRTKLITDLPLAEVLGGAEIFPVTQFGVAKKTSTLDVINFTKQQDFAAWVYAASSNLITNDISAKYINLYNNPISDGLDPKFFIGKAGYFSTDTLQVSGLSGFQFYFNEPTDRFVFVSYASSISGNRNLTAYYLDQNAYMYITNLSTSNTLSAKNIYVTDQITISANSNLDALFIVQNGQGNAFEIFDEINDITPFVVTASGNVGIKTPSPVIDLTIAGSVSASQTLSARNINVLDRVGIATSSPNETLTVAGNISARDVIFDGRLNSNRWFETYTNYSAASANEARVATFVNSNSSNIVNVNTTVNNTSANWNSVYSNWNSLSAFDLRARTYVGSNSANFSDSISLYNTASGTYATYVYANQGFLPLSGGEISSGVVRISGATTFGSDVTIVGRLCANLLTVLKTESIPVTASTLNVEGSGRFEGRFEVGNVASFDSNLFVSGFANVTGNVLSNGTITSRQFLQDLNSNSREWGSVYNRWREVSALDLDVRTFTNSNSSNISNVNTTVNTTSANWNSVYSSWNSNSASVIEAETFVQSNSSNILNVNTKVNAASSIWDRSSTVTSQTSANWNSAYSRFNSVSALDLDVRTFTNANSSNIRNVNTTVNTTSANWNSVYSHWNSNSASVIEAETFVQSNSSNIRNVNTTVNTTSANWNSVYSHWNSNSASVIEAETFVQSNSSNIRNVNTTVNTTSAKWNSVYNSFFSLSGAIGEGLTEFQESSARYNRVSTRMEVTSANWNSVYSTFQANSAKYNSERGNLNIALSGTSLVSVPNHAIGFMDIYLNGIKLIAGQDFTETATTITLTEPTKYNNYKLEYVVYGAYNVANAVSKTGDTMSGNLTVPSLIVNNSFSTPNLYLDRQDTSLEGGQITFRRASDNDDKYFIDVIGSGSNPDLRIFEKTGPSSFLVRATLQGSTGNLGIGMTNPSAKAYIYQDHATQVAAAIQTSSGSGGDALWIYHQGTGAGIKLTHAGASGNCFVVEDTASDTTPFVIANDGSLTIGQMATNLGTVGIGLNLSSEVNSSPNSNIQISRIGGDSTSNGGRLRIIRSRGTTLSNTAVADGDDLGGIVFGGWNGTTLSLPSTITCRVDGTVSGTSVPSRISISTTQVGNTTATERIRITNDGKVGINTTTPNHAVTVVGSISATGIIYGDGAGLKSIDLDRKFKQFREPRSLYTAGPTNWKMGSFLSETGKLYLAGYSYNNLTSFGTVGNAAYAYPNFVPAMLYGAGSDIPENETITKYYMGAREMFVYTDAGYLYGIGRNARGELGCGDQTQRSMWTRVSNLNNITDFSPPNSVAGYYVLNSTYYYNDPFGFCLAIKDGRLYQWGEGRSWNSGRGATMSTGDVGVSTSPTLVNVGAMQNKTNCVKCYAINDDYTSYGYGVVIDSNRDIFVTGSNFYGQLGLSDTVNRGQYVQVPTIKGDDVGAVMWNGYSTTFVLDRQLNRLYGSGYNSSGQLGINPSTNLRSTFAQIPGLENNVKEFALGGTHGAICAAILLDGSIRTWGGNFDGILGHNGTTNTHIPTKPTNTGNTVFIKVKIAGAYLNLWAFTAYFLDNQGRIWSTGYNGHGQRGNGTFDSGGLINIMRTPPNVYFVDFDVGGFYSTAPSAGGGHFIHALDSDGNLWACGDNEYWQGGVGFPAQSLPTFRRCIVA